MTALHADETVLLTQDIPELELHRGDIGIICSVWSIPGVVFEVEFHKLNPESRLRAMLAMNQIAPIMEVYGPFMRGVVR